jgi:hypothetical protein
MHFVGAAFFKAFGSGGLPGEEEDLGFGSGDDEEGGNVAEGGGSGGGSGAAVATPQPSPHEDVTTKMQDARWLTVARKLAQEQGVSLEQYLFDSHVGRETLKGYKGEMGRWEAFVAEKTGVVAGGGAWMNEPLDRLAPLMVEHIRDRVMGSRSGACSFIGQLSAACNYFTLLAGKEDRNPFKHHTVKQLKVSVGKSSGRARDGKVKARVMSTTEQRQLMSYIVHRQLNRTNFHITSYRLVAALNLSVYLAHRGDNTRSARLDHVLLMPDPNSPFLCTMWLFTPFSKTDQNGVGVYRPILRLPDDGYRCPLLSLSMYLLLARPALEKADEETPREYDANGDQLVRPIFLFPANDRNSVLTFATRWSSSAALRDLKGIARTALKISESAPFGLTWHSSRHGFYDRAVLGRLTNLQSLTWAGHASAEISDEYKHPSPEQMMSIAHALTGEEPFREDPVAPYGGRLHGGVSTVTPDMPPLPALFTYASTVVATFAGKERYVSLKAKLEEDSKAGNTEALLTCFQELLPPYAPITQYIPRANTAKGLGVVRAVEGSGSGAAQGGGGGGHCLRLRLRLRLCPPRVPQPILLGLPLPLMVSCSMDLLL